MNASLYLKRKLLAERKIAASLEKGIKHSFIAAEETMDDVYSGLERASWYLSCLSDKYRGVCQELKAEDVRMIKALLALYKNKDIIEEIFIRYIDYILKHADPSQAKNLVINISGFTAEALAGKATREVLAYSLVRSILTSSKFTASLKHVSNKILFNGFTAVQFYGKVQKAARASRRLKKIDPDFHQILYLLDIEMLYIYVEPVLAEIITKVNALPNATPEEIIKIIQGMSNV